MSSAADGGGENGGSGSAGRDGRRTLADLAPRSSGTVAAVDGSPALVQRLFEMGLTPGTKVEVVRFAPLGDPVEIRVRGYLLSLRKSDARGVRLAEGA